MSMMAKILRSEDTESAQRQIQRIEKEIEYLTIDLEIKKDKLNKIKRR